MWPTSMFSMEDFDDDTPTGTGERIIRGLVIIPKTYPDDDGFNRLQHFCKRGLPMRPTLVYVYVLTFSPPWILRVAHASQG